MNIQFWRLLEGQSFNAKYKLKKLLGFGAYGGVFLADEVIGNTFMRTVALKVILIDPDRRNSQIKELQISTTLNHAHILRCFTSELGNPNGMDCLGLVMELGDESLDKRLAKGVLAPDLVREMVKGWASALQNTHSQSPAIIHRDLKPANILRVGNDWKISDFGVARLVGGKTASNTMNVIGTLPYMPPDAYNGEISPAFDIWSMGVMIVEMLTGNLPFYGSTVQELQVAVQSKEPQINGKLPAPFDQIVKGCLIKDRKQRWTAKQVLNTLETQSINLSRFVDNPIHLGLHIEPGYERKLPKNMEEVHEKMLRGLITLTEARYQMKNLQEEIAGDRLILGVSDNLEIKMVSIPSGKLVMESGYDVNIKAFKMGLYPITQAQYEAVMRNNPSHFKENPQNPVEQVSWDDAVKFCEEISQQTGEKVRLPNETEWEYACRAGSSSRYYFGDNDNDLKDYAWYEENSGSKTHPVGEKHPNRWGLYDMYGNVSEWCADSWTGDNKQLPKDGKAFIDNNHNPSRAIRGGSWNDDGINFRSGNRHRFLGYLRSDVIGFRVVV